MRLWYTVYMMAVQYKLQLYLKPRAKSHLHKGEWNFYLKNKQSCSNKSKNKNISFVRGLIQYLAVIKNCKKRYKVIFITNIFLPYILNSFNLNGQYIQIFKYYIQITIPCITQCYSSEPSHKFPKGLPLVLKKSGQTIKDSW
jgi:hypothetical protein